MKLAIAWFSMLTLLIVISCSVNHRSGDYDCTTKACTAPRVCEQGFCVVPDNVPIDAPPGTVDGRLMTDAKIAPDALLVCPSQCTSCDLNAHTCKIECSASTGNCNGEVVCPPGFNCNIGCNAPNSCRNGVVCTDATACTISCGGQNSCRNVMCGNGPCAVYCNGSGSCHGVDCGPACACDVSCAGAATTNSCQNVICSDLTCSVGLGCSSTSPGCSNCN